MRFAVRMRRLNEWHRWFAWHPVRVTEELVWLEAVERRGERCKVQIQDSDPDVYPTTVERWQWEYRA